MLGIAPGSRLVSVKAGAADGSVDVTQVIAAINWVIKNKRTDGRNIRVLNLSFGTDGTQDYRTDPLTHAVERAWRAGIVVVVAGGNDGWSAGRLTNPAQDPFVIAVGSSQAVDGREDVPSSYSEGSSTGRGVDLSAPGRSIASVRNVGATSDAANTAGRVGDSLVRGSGTSQAAAVVSGAAALLLSSAAGADPRPGQARADDDRGPPGGWRRRPRGQRLPARGPGGQGEHPVRQADLGALDWHRHPERCSRLGAGGPGRHRPRR